MITCLKMSQLQSDYSQEVVDSLKQKVDFLEGKLEKVCAADTYTSHNSPQLRVLYEKVSMSFCFRILFRY